MLLSELKYTNELKKIINDEFNNPSEDFVRFFAKRVYGGMVTAKVVEQFAGLIKRSLNVYVNDRINERLKSALSSEPKDEQPKQDEQSEQEDGNSKIITTVEELQAFTLIRSILRKDVDVSRISYKDNIHYFSVLLDGWKVFCRLRLDGKSKSVGVFRDGKEARLPIETIDDIYGHYDAILKSLKSLLKDKKNENAE